MNANARDDFVIDSRIHERVECLGQVMFACGGMCFSVCGDLLSRIRWVGITDTLVISTIVAMLEKNRRSEKKRVDREGRKEPRK